MSAVIPTVWWYCWKQTFAGDEPNTLNTVEIAITSIELAILRGSTANHPWQSTERGLVADESMQIEVSDPSDGHVAPSSPVSLLRTTT